MKGCWGQILIQVVIPHPIQQNKAKKKRVGGVVGLTRNNAPIHHRSQLPTLIPTNHVPIVMHLSMMPITILHFTHNYCKANYKIPMPIKIKVLKRGKKGKVHPTKG
jgi:hypothetical protein